MKKTPIFISLLVNLFGLGHADYLREHVLSTAFLAAKPGVRLICGSCEVSLIEAVQ